MRFEWKTVLLAFLFLFSFTSVSADVVINSDNWREVAIGMNYAELKGEDFRIIDNLGEAKLAPEIVEEPVVVLESRRSQTVENYEMFLKNQGLNNVETQQLDLNSSYSFYNQLEDDVKGFLIVKPGFSEETVIGLPEASRKNYLLLYYSKGRTEEFLNRHSSKKAVFVGGFPERPWKKIENNYKTVTEGSALNNSLKLAEPYLRESEGVKAAAAAYLTKGLAQKEPVILLKDVERVSNFLEENNANFIEIIGPENAVYGTRVRELTNGDVRAIVKTARTFTGNPELSGKEVPIQRIQAKPRTTEIKIRNAYHYKNKIGLKLANTGTSTAEFNIAGIETSNPEANPSVNSSRYFLKPGSTLILEASYSKKEKPEKVEVLVYRKGEALKLSSSVQEKSRGFVKPSLETGDPVYIEEKRVIRVPVKNKGDEGLNVSAFITGLELGGREFVLESSESLDAGESGELVFSAYLSEEERDQAFNLSLAAGGSEGYIWIGSERKKIEGVKGIAAFTRSRTGVAAVVLVLILVIYLFRRFEAGKKLDIAEFY
ncbi:MAG: hypothetical protein ABEJ93_02510 [Candidatus Nanohalobium sp.]